MRYKIKKEFYDKYKLQRDNLIKESFVSLMTELDLNNIHSYLEVHMDKILGLKSEVLNGDKYVSSVYDGVKFYVRTYSKNIEGFVSLEVLNETKMIDLKLTHYYKDNKVSLESYDRKEKKLLLINLNSLSGTIEFNDFNDISRELELVSVILDELFVFDKENTEAKSLDVLELMQDSINKIVEYEYFEDSCKPLFTLSVMGYKEEAKIVLNIEHNNLKFSSILFPNEHITYNNGLNIYEEIRCLYNRTM